LVIAARRPVIADARYGVTGHHRVRGQTAAMRTPSPRYPVTPDGRYFVVRGRLWRCSDPSLPEAERTRLTQQLMHARSAIGRALRARDAGAERLARAEVDAAKIALGERGPPWWDDGAPDYNRRMARNTPYAAWFETLP
jgi:hypothetical protein